MIALNSDLLDSDVSLIEPKVTIQLPVMLKRDSIDLFFPDAELAAPDCLWGPVPKDSALVKQAPKKLSLESRC